MNATQTPARVTAVTGGIGSGKSEVGRYLQQRGATVIDADRLVHELLADPKSNAVMSIAEQFGHNLLGQNGIDRIALGKIVFEQPDKRKQLESIVHPAVRILLATRLGEVMDAGRWAVVEVPLLFESGMQVMFPETWLITADMERRIERIRARDKLNRNDIVSRIDAQWSDEQKMPLATHVLYNNGTTTELHQQIDNLLVPS